MEAPRFHILALAILTLGVLSTPQSEAQSASTWTTETVPTGGSVCNRVIADNEGEELGLLCYTTSTTTAIFALRSSAGVWAVKNTDVNGADATYKQAMDLVSLGSDKWVAVLQDVAGTGSRAFYSIDDGATWTSGGTMTQYVNGGQLRQIAGDTIGYVNGGTSNGAYFSKSTDKGATWSTPLRIDDNQGAPSGSATANIGANNYGPGLHVNDANTYAAILTTTSAAFIVSSSDGGSFWSTPYTVNAGTTQNPYTAWNTNCPGGSVNNVNGAAYGTYGTGAWVKVSVTNPYICAGNAPVGATTGVASIMARDGGGRVPIDDNAAGQSLVAYADNAATPNLYVYYKAPAATTWSQVYTNTQGPGANQVDLIMSPTKGWVFYADNVNGGVLKAAWASAFVAVTPTVAATASVTNLVGFDVDPTGATAIARTEAGDKVTTWDAQGLGTGVTDDTNCVFGGGITAAVHNIAYIDTCDGEDTIKIRSSTFGTPDIPGDCTAAQADAYESWDVVGVDEALINIISDLGTISINWDTSTTADCKAYAILPFSTTDGRIGILTGKFVDDPTAERSVATVQYLVSSQAVTAMCGQIFVDDTIGGTGTDYGVVAVNSAANTVAYRWNVDFFTPTLSLYKSYSGVLGSQSSVDCSNTDSGNILVGGSAVRLLSLVTGTQIWARTDLGAPQGNGVAMSYDGDWAAVAVGSNTYVLNATDGTTLLTVPNPSGTFRAIRLDSTGQNLWIATSTTVNRYEITAYTTGDPEETCISICFPVFTGTQTGSSSGTTTGGAFLGTDAGAIATALSITESGANGFLGVLLMLGISAPVFAATKNKLAGGAAAVAGLAMAYFFGFFPLWVVLLVVLLGAAAVVLLGRR